MMSLHRCRFGRRLLLLSGHSKVSVRRKMEIFSRNLLSRNLLSEGG